MQIIIIGFFSIVIGLGLIIAGFSNKLDKKLITLQEGVSIPKIATREEIEKRVKDLRDKRGTKYSDEDLFELSVLCSRLQELNRIENEHLITKRPI
jgi:hypothetical protein